MYGERAVYNKTKDIFANLTQLHSIKAITTSYYSSDFIGHILHSVHLNPGVMTHNLMTTCRFELHHNLSYWVVVTDPKLQFLTASPTAFSRDFEDVKKDAGSLLIYLEAIC